MSPEQNAKDAKSFAKGGNGKLSVSVLTLTKNQMTRNLSLPRRRRRLAKVLSGHLCNYSSRKF
jgi:hypothetical protein